MAACEAGVVCSYSVAPIDAYGNPTTINPDEDSIYLLVNGKQVVAGGAAINSNVYTFGVRFPAPGEYMLALQVLKLF